MESSSTPVQIATKIASDYCEKNNPNRSAVYRGMFKGGFLFLLRFNKSGHHGNPVFAIVRNGEIVVLESNTPIHNQAWDSAISYAASQDGL